MNQSQLDTLRQQLANTGWRLRFPAALESEFQADYATRYLRHMQLAMLLGMFGLLSCGAVDWAWMPSVASKLWTVRLLMALPMLAILGYTRTSAGGRQMQLLTLVAACVGAGEIVICSLYTPDPFSHYYRCGLTLVILIVFVLSRLQFNWGLVTAFIILSELNLGLAYGGNSLVIFTVTNFVVVAATVFSLIGTFLIERSLRQNYLQARLLSFENHDLEESNLRLEYLTAVDGLTQLANRRSLDMSLSTEWQRALRKQEPLALIMIDVDHFKLFNDHYGHQAGDECLRGVAGAIKDVARRPGDLAARYGGEEFCIVLTGASAEQATQVAERARDKIVSLAIPHQRSSHGQVTASFGVASTIPGHDTGPEQLLLAADQALYQAKKSGRNKVAQAGEENSREPATETA